MLRHHEWKSAMFTFSHTPVKRKQMCKHNYMRLLVWQGSNEGHTLTRANTALQNCLMYDRLMFPWVALSILCEVYCDRRIGNVQCRTLNKIHTHNIK